MNHDDDKRSERHAPRRPYQPPQVLFREPLEAVATVCTNGKSPAQPIGNCAVIPSS
ncbi:MAG: hypothetical protein KC543_03090 [Myxococcales bacterium]|nr:hypothetical protein [Myxococcales bacterium]